MDETTQQNSALVEENAATAKTLENQARSMDQRVASFRLRAGPTGGYPTDGGEAADGDAPRMEAQGLPPSRGPAAKLRLASAGR